MKSHSESDDLDAGTVDYSLALARGAAGLVPIVGPILGEVIGTKIPGQRVDRIVKFAQDLDRRLEDVEQSTLESMINDEEFADLIEEGVRQAARSIAEERRGYIAALIANGLSSDDVNLAESKHLLRILNEINDVEVVWLRFYRVPYVTGDEKFREAHEHILAPARFIVGASREARAKATLQESYKEHLCQLGLLDARYDVDFETRLPKFDSDSGSMRVRDYELSSLGRLLLEAIDLDKDQDDS